MAGLAKNISTYTLGNILNKGVQFLLLPLYTHILLPSDFGKLELTYLVGAILAILYGLLVETGYSRIYFDLKDVKERKRLFGTGQFFNFICAIFFISITYTFSKEIANLFFDFAEGEVLLKLVSISAAVKIFTAIPMNNLRNRQKAKTYISVNFLALVINVSLTIYFLVVLKTGIEGILYAQITGALIELIVLYFILHSEISFQISGSLLKTMLSFSVFLILPNMSSLVIAMSNRYFLQEYQNLEEVGLFSLGYKVASIIPFLITEPVKKAFGPHIFSFVDDPEKCKTQLTRFTRYFVAILSFTVLIISIFSFELISIMSNQSFHSSYSIVFVLTLSYMLMGLAGIVVLGIQITKKTWIITAIWPFAAVLNVSLNIWLIPLYGKEGATYATVLSSMFILTSYFMAVYKLYYVKFEYIKYLMILLLTAFIYYVSTYLTGLNFFLIIAIKITMVIFYIMLILKLNYFSKEEIIFGKNKVLSYIKK
jgi:O-antigen/teichoic acid export membrane protein